MLKQTIESVYQTLVKRRAEPVLSVEKQTEICTAAKRVRCVDYVASWDITNGTGRAETVVTRANWRFILTNITVFSQYIPEEAGAFPDFVFNFQNLPFTGSFLNVTDPALLNTVWSKLAIGGQDNGVHFEESRNVLFVLPERAIIETVLKPHIMWGGSIYPNNRGSILYTGVEIQMR